MGGRWDEELGFWVVDVFGGPENDPPGPESTEAENQEDLAGIDRELHPDGLTALDRQRILGDAILERPLAPDASEAEKKSRAACDQDAEAARRAGVTLDVGDDAMFVVDRGERPRAAVGASHRASGFTVSMASSRQKTLWKPGSVEREVNADPGEHATLPLVTSERACRQAARGRRRDAEAKP